MSKVKFDVSGEYGKMIFPSGKVVLFDKEDLRKIQSYSSWQINDARDNHLRVRAITRNADGKMKYTTLSNILGFVSGKTVHINGNPLDVRKDNLAIRTRQQIKYSEKVRKNSLSGVKGVVKSGEKWVAHIGYDNESYYLGTYDNKSDAVKARVLAEKIYCHGHLNDQQKFLHTIF